MKRRGYVLWLFLFVLFSVSVSMAQGQAQGQAEKKSGADNAMDSKAAELYNKGNDYMKDGDFDAAVKSYSESLNIDKDYRTYYQLGVALKKADKLSEAKEAFANSIKVNPNFDLAYNGLGGVNFQLGEMDEAIQNFQMFEQKTSKENLKKMARELIGRSYAKKGSEALSKGNSDDAIDFLNKSVQIFNFDAAYLNLAKAYVEAGQNDKAIEAAGNALKYRESISKGGPYYYMGLAYKNKGDNSKAAENFKLSTSDANYKKVAEHELASISKQ